MRKSIHTPEYAALRSQLQDARKTAGLSQRELASRLHVPHSWIAKVENGERRIDLIEFCWFIAGCGADAEAACRKLTREIGSRKPSQRVGGRSK
jgi:transcriptional regulator with XRE-family HTH domain